MQKLTLNDLKPEEATFTLDAFPDTQFTLKRFSLAAQIWCRDKFGAEKMKRIFETQSLPEISEIVFYLLKDSALSYEEFLEGICSYQDKVRLITALLATVGISQPVMERIKKEATENPQTPSPSKTKRTGAKSTT